MSDGVNRDDELENDLGRMLSAAEMEAQLHPTETMKERSQRILDDAAPVAAMSIVQLAQRASNENLRFRAAQYILDRVLGDTKGAGSDPAWKHAFDGVIVPDDASSLTAE